MLKARIGRAPKLIEAKDRAIINARKQVGEAPNPYEKSRAQKNLTTLEASLTRLKDNLEKDKAELERILNEEVEG